MKKLSAVQVKQQALVLNVADKLEVQGREEIPGMLQCWFDVEYHLFPSSLLLCFQFENEQALAAAEPDLLKWQKRLSAAMLKKGVILKDMRKHLVFTRLSYTATVFYGNSLLLINIVFRSVLSLARVCRPLYRYSVVVCHFPPSLY